MSANKTAVVALGGNAITRPGKVDTIATQFAHTRSSLGGVIELARMGYGVVLTHGNGPQVGNALLRVELARGKAPILPLGVVVADTEGGIGYMIGQSLANRLAAEKIDRPTVTIVTQVLVDRNDPAFENPTKFIGQFYSEEEADSFARTRGWRMKADGERGWRRVVPSPIPYKTVEAATIRKLVEDGAIVIAAGGGGIPVYIDEKGNLEGVDAVVDKDRASAVVAGEIGAELLLILTSVEKVSIDFSRPDQKELDRVSLSEIKEYLKQGHFPPGSMGPKIEAAITFLEAGGRTATIASMEQASEAVRGEAGTRIYAD